MLIAILIGHHVLGAFFFFHHWIFHPLTGEGYQFWSGIASDLGEVTLIGGALALIKHANCDAPRCLRYGPHRTADGQHKLCRHHHPDLPNHRLSLEEIHARHRKIKASEIQDKDFTRHAT